MNAVPLPACSLVIPAYNEENRIPRLLRELSGFRGPLIFVCDGTDRTAAIIEEFSRQESHQTIHILRFSRRLGKGGGVLEGLKAAETSCVGFMDADGSTSRSEMERLFSLIDSADGVIGSRWLPDSRIPVKQSTWRRIESRIFNLFVRLFYRLPYTDTQCGAKVFRREALDAVLPRMLSRGFEFDVELLWRLRAAGYHIIEVPTRWENTGDSRVSGSDAGSMLLSLVKLRFSSLFYRKL
jgi:dolichol-phosphate mannosyltransferase